MKKTIFIFVFALFISQFAFPQRCGKNTGFYFGIGTSLSSYIGSDFGSTFSMRYSRSRDYDYNWYNYNYYNHYNRYDDYYTETFFPLQVDVAMGIDASDKFSFQLESSILWHLNGNPRRYYEAGSIGEYDYLDRNDYSELISIPIIASIKYYPFGRRISSFYITGGYSMQYMQESVDRVRTFYSFNSYWNEYSNTSEYTLASYRARDWFHGVKVGLGFTYNLSRYLRCDVELNARNFFPAGRDNSSYLSMYRSPNITNVALSSKIFFEL